jgi:hypothetical protein
MVDSSPNPTQRDDALNARRFAHSRRRASGWLTGSRRQWVLVGALFLAVIIVGLVLESSKSPKAAGTSDSSRRIVDSFKRTGGSLGRSDSGDVWTEVRGKWATSAKTARVRQPAPLRSIAVVDSRTRGGTVAVTVATPCAGCGLVFRFRDPSNYWRLVASPQFATWGLSKVVNGQERLVATTGLSSSRPGTVVSVSVRDSRIEVGINSILRISVLDTDLLEAPGVGLIGTGATATQGRWSAFMFSGAPTTFKKGQAPVQRRAVTSTTSKPTPATAAPGPSTTAAPSPKATTKTTATPAKTTIKAP